MNITEMIGRLEELKERYGDLPLFFFKRCWVRKIKQCDVICVAKGNSDSMSDGVYLRVPGEDESC